MWRKPLVSATYPSSLRRIQFIDQSAQNDLQRDVYFVHFKYDVQPPYPPFSPLLLGEITIVVAGAAWRYAALPIGWEIICNF